ncbi:MAG: hypothetical protein ACOCXQ_04545 [Patescibacteria group bacterium]
MNKPIGVLNLSGYEIGPEIAKTLFPDLCTDGAQIVSSGIPDLSLDWQTDHDAWSEHLSIILDQMLIALSEIHDKNVIVLLSSNLRQDLAFWIGVELVQRGLNSPLVCFISMSEGILRGSPISGTTNAAYIIPA